VKGNSSISWREEGDLEAFDHRAWEFKSRQFETSAKHLLQAFDDQLEAPTFESIMLLPTAEFLLSLAVELICKAHYLKHNAGAREAIYQHEVASLCEGCLFNPEQLALMQHAERYVMWAGRYPSPKWTKEAYKEEYDVPSSFVGGIEHIDAAHIPNTASRPRAEQLLALYWHIHNAWRTTEDA
jgi:hypothetical protein